ncbi:hypothetical protein [Aquimarina algicola]|uniref:Uncharacterized protein n=1 Tax=Aquimarina algicola TaxID=2589995 RepID=A0A504JKU3_9FLAO|nr:hypothetical protein [Aquimarina algicola]TPN87171.1 hypothetical protein FHK87_06155 [Aquimarina algicola]
MNTNEKKEMFIEITELSEIIKATDLRATMKWCEDYNLPIIPVGNKKMTYRFLAEAALDNRIIQVLKKLHPSNWKNLYNLYKDNDLFGYQIATQNESAEPLTLETRTTKKNQPVSKYAQLLAKD